MDEVNIGSVVLSLAGRDSGRIFIVLAVEGNFAFLVDGNLRRVEKPKKKKLKHLKLIGPSASEKINFKLENGQKLENAEIRKALSYLSSQEVM